MREQGTMVDCVYCKHIRPEFQGTENCPHCHGNTPEFKPMRMMDQSTSGQEILLDMLDMQFSEDPATLSKDLLNLLSRIEVYNFDLKASIIRFIQNNEENA